jgi:sulfur carrier protein ThiS
MTNNVIAQILGGEKRILDGVNTVADVKAKMGASGYAAAVNGSPADDSQTLSEGDIVTLSKAVKGGI